MRTVLFQASRTIGKDDKGNAIKQKVTKEVTIPTTDNELLGVLGARGKVTITIGYNADGTRIREEVDFVTAMYLEGLKLAVGKEIAPEAEEESDEELAAALEKLPEQARKMAEWCLSELKGKSRKDKRNQIVEGTWKSPF